MEGVEGGWLHLFRLTHSTMTNLGFRNAWQKTVTVAAPFGCRSRLDRTSSHRIRGGVAGFNPTVNQLDCPYCPVQFEVMEISNVGQIVLNLKDFYCFYRYWIKCFVLLELINVENNENWGSSINFVMRKWKRKRKFQRRNFSIFKNYELL